MNADQREAVRSNAKYLHNVRPLDPEEISEYVEGQPHPAAVRQVLRESAVELGLVERGDGLFVPVEEGPVAVTFDGVETFPERYGRVLEDLLVERYGAGWPEGDSGRRIRERIRAVKAAYLRGEAVEYDAETALAYAVYHLPGYYAATQYVLAELVADRLLSRRLRVLDVGAGVGGPALGLCDLLPEEALLDYHAVEPGAGADVLEEMLPETGRNVHAAIHRTTAEAFDPSEVGDGGGSETDGQFDLILFANVLSELADPESALREYADALATDGTLVALAPADRNTAVGMRAVERAVADRGPYDVYAPTVRLWPGETPADDCWSFDVRPDLAVPGFQRRLDTAVDDQGSPSDDPDGTAPRDSEFVNVDVQFAYSLLRRDGRRRYDFQLDPSRAARFADSENHVTNRVDCYAAKLSHDLADGGNPLFLLGDGSQRVSHFAVLTKETALNADLANAGYGEVLAFENVLVLWNDDEEAFNLVVDDETVVDRVPP
ncbi:SAM-dependent methyltransferase [Halobacteriales archaeon QH_3_68_24]|nr:MAG: SAM-dependent methyltransferase [Halobacteriales archaeon QH_3_68_24]